MRILHIIDTLGVGGGAERNLVSVVPAMRGHQHHVVHLLEPDGFAPVLREAGAVVERVPYNDPRDVPRVIARLRELAGRCDVVHTQIQFADLLGRAAALGRAPVVTSVQTPPYAPEALASYSRLGRAKTYVIRASDVALSTQNERFIAVSRYVRDVLAQQVRVPVDKVRVIYNAIDLKVMGPLPADERAAMRASLGLRDGEVAIVSGGKLMRSKGQDLLVEAMPAVLAEVPQARLLLAGEGPLRATLEQRIGELGLAGRVTLLGLRKDMPRVLGACDVFSLASHFEGLPLSVAEAMAVQLPSVLSPIDPHVEMRERMTEVHAPHSETMVADSMRPASFARALARVAGLSEAERRAMGEAARAVAERHFNAEVTGPAMLGVFAEAAGFPASAASVTR